MRFDAVINRFMFDANFSKRIQIHGNGKQHRAFVHVNVLIKALIGSLLESVPSGIYNIVDKNLEILDVVDVLKEIYPSLEFLFVNQHLELKQMKVDRISVLRNYLDFENKLTLKDELLDFKDRFSF